MPQQSEPKKIKVSDAEIEAKRAVTVKEDSARDNVDAIDRSFGRIFSTIGKYFGPDGDFWK